MRRRLWAALGAVVLVLICSAACGGATDDGAGSPPAATKAVPGEPPAVLDLAMRDLAFDRQTVELTAGDAVELRLANRGTLPHDVTIDRIPADVQVMHADGRVGNGRSDVHVALDGGKTAAIRLRGRAPGDYVFYCSVSGHRQAGMEGKVVVR